MSNAKTQCLTKIKKSLHIVLGTMFISAFYMLSFTPAVHATDYNTRLYPNTTLYAGESVWSPSHNYRLLQQADGNLVEYSMPGYKPFWASGTSGHPGSVTHLQSDGNFVVYAPGHNYIWASGTSGHSNSVLYMQDDAYVE